MHLPFIERFREPIVVVSERLVIEHLFGVVAQSALIAIGLFTICLTLEFGRAHTFQSCGVRAHVLDEAVEGKDSGVITWRASSVSPTLHSGLDSSAICYQMVKEQQ